MKQKRSVLTKKYLNIAWFKDQSVVFVIHVVVVASTIKSCWFRRFWQIPETCSSLIMYVCSSTKPGLLTSFSVDPALDQLIANWTVKLEDSRREFPWGIQDLSFNPRQEFTFFSMGQKKFFNGFLKQPRVDTYLELAVIAKDLKSTLTKGVSQSV